MTTFDLVSDEVESKFGIGRAKASALVLSLLSLMSDHTDGVRGFFDRLERAGLRNWLLSGKDTAAIAADRLQTVVGKDTLEKIASKSGLSLAAASSAVGFLLPRIFQRIAPGGVVPSRLPSEMIPTGPAVAGARGPAIRQASYPAERIVIEKSTEGQYAWVPPAMLLLGILVGGWLWLSRRPAQSVAMPVSEMPAATQQAVQTPQAAPTPVSVSDQDVVRALNRNVIHFATGSAELTEDSYASLNKAAATLKSMPAGMRLQIVGHADSQGDEAANLNLSRQRANTVRDYLVQQGVSPDELIPAGNGQTEPAATNETEEGRYQNRRIEFSALP